MNTKLHEVTGPIDWQSPSDAQASEEFASMTVEEQAQALRAAGDTAAQELLCQGGLVLHSAS